MPDLVYALPDDETTDALKNALEQSFSGLIETSDTLELDLYDTFDWRLYKKARALVKQGSLLMLMDLQSGAQLVDHICRAKQTPRFWWDFTDSDFKEQLKPLADIRSLQCVVKLQQEQTIWRLLNEDEKTVARVILEKTIIEEADRAIRRCILAPVRGYRREAKRIAKLLKANGLKGDPKPIYTRVFKKAGVKPGAYTSKVNLTLKPDMNTRDAVMRILAYLVGIMRLNEEGVRQDIDTEFLHDLRVSVRRSRTLISQLKGVLDAQDEALLKTELRRLGQLTGRLRDLDVYLLEQSRYEEMVPEPLRPGVVRLFRSLKVKRANEFKKVAAAMNGSEYEQILTFLENFVKQAPDDALAAENALVPAIDTAKSVIHKRYRKIIKSGGEITHVTPDSKLHRLRINCKKLRYLLEFFSSLFPPDEIKALIKQLKKLQDNLGTFNDLSVQQTFLYTYLQNMRSTSTASLQLAAATGGLIVRLNREQIEVRRDFFKVFQKFAAKDNRQRFKQLFK